jgi:hypothetical protein
LTLLVNALNPCSFPFVLIHILLGLFPSIFLSTYTTTFIHLNSYSFFPFNQVSSNSNLPVPTKTAKYVQSVDKKRQEKENNNIPSQATINLLNIPLPPLKPGAAVLLALLRLLALGFAGTST